MKLIIGLGNPEKKYENTRHNTGFMAVDRLADDWQEKPKFHGFVAEIEVDGERAVLLKPATYYNDSGLGARAIKDFYKLLDADILVVHDELALPFGTVRTRVGKPGTDDAGNRGVKSIDDHLKTKVYARVRVGIGQEDRQQAAQDFVLSRFSSDEKEKLEELRQITDQIILDFVRGQFEQTSHKIS